MTSTIGIPCVSFVPLGILYENRYFISDECLTCLTEINARINCEDPITRPLRRTLIFFYVLHKDLFPILIHIKKNPRIFRSTIKLLVWMTIPVSCLISAQQEKSRQSSSANINFMKNEFTQFLYNAKEAFLYLKITRIVLEHLNSLTLNQPLISKDDCELVSYLLLLIRNILHAPERPTSKNTDYDGDDISCGNTSDYPQQRQLLGVLFAQGFGQILIHLLSCSQKGEWVVTIVQLLALLYKDYDAQNIQKLLSDDEWVNTSGTTDTSFEFSDDDESSTSQHYDMSSSYFESDSDESSTSSITSVENISSLKRNNFETNITTHGGTIFKVKSEINRTKRTIRKVSIRNPSTEDIYRLLTKFTSNFMLNGFNILVYELHQKLLQQDKLLLAEKSYFLWLITYFLRFAYSPLKLGVQYLKDVLTTDLLCYLTWDAIHETEEFEIISLKLFVDLKPNLRGLMLGVTAIREYVQALDRYCAASQEDSLIGMDELLVEWYMPIMHILRQLLVLRLRLYNPILQSRHYLCDIITANHVLLLTLERMSQNSADGVSFDIWKHLDQFCSKTILHRYGTALGDFKTNGIFINGCILTILHHVGLDLGRADLLCDPIILRPFSQMRECKFNLCPDWEDLIEFIVRKFMFEFHDCCTAMLGNNDRGSSEMQETSCSKLSTDDELSLSDVELLRNQLIKCGYRKQLDWIQKSLLTVCSARLSDSDTEFQNPVVCLSLKMKKPCWIIPWTEVEASALLSKPFKSLLYRIGLLQFDDQQAAFPRIPLEWSVDTTYSVALFFGPVEQQQVNFSLNRVTKVELPFSSNFYDGIAGLFI